HFGLKTNGVLGLGPSESPGELGDEFEAVDQRWKVFRKRRAVRLLDEMRPPAAPRGRPAVEFAALVPPGFDSHLLGAYDALLDECLPPSRLLNDHQSVVTAVA